MFVVQPKVLAGILRNSLMLHVSLFVKEVVCLFPLVFQEAEDSCVLVVSNLPESGLTVEEVSNLTKPFGGLREILIVSSHKKVFELVAWSRACHQDRQGLFPGLLSHRSKSQFVSLVVCHLNCRQPKLTSAFRSMPVQS